MLISVLVRKGKLAHITLDAELYERHTATSRVTRYPVETGVNISDHISIEPEAVTIEGLISDSPIIGGNATGRYMTAFHELNRLWETRSLVTVVTHLKIYEEMAIRHLEFPRDGHTGGALRFTADLQKVVKAEARTTKVPAEILAPPVKDQGQTSKDMGHQNTEPMEKEGEWESTLGFDLGQQLGIL